MKRLKSSPPTINAGSMADIAFLLLVFFLVTTTMLKDESINRKLPPKITVVEPSPIPDRDVLEILVNKYDELLVEGNPVTIDQIKDIAYEFILNEQDLPNLPRKKTTTIAGLGEIEMSRQVISLQNDIKASYGIYVSIQDELSAAYLAARNTFSKQHFGEDFETLIKSNQFEKVEAIKDAIPQRISEAEPNI